MIITEKCEIKNKVMIFSELTRVDEALATLIENQYDDVDATYGALETLECMGLEMELKLNDDNLWANPLFDEIQEIRDGLISEIMDCDFDIHYNKKYGYDQPLEYYIENNMVII